MFFIGGADMKDLVKIWYSKPTLLNAAEAVVEIYGSSLVGGIPARDNEWHVPLREARDRKPYCTRVLYAPTVDDLQRKIPREYDEKEYIIEYIEV